MCESTSHLIGTKQFLVLAIAQIIYLVGCVPPSGVVTRKWRPPRAQKRHLVTDSCHVVKVFIGHLALRNKIPVQSVGQRQMDNDIENCN